MSQETEKHPQPTTDPQPFQRDAQEEISLRDLWLILVRRKRTILLSTGLCMLLAVIYLALSVTTYQSTAMLRIGQVAGTPMGNGTQVAVELKNQYTPINTLQAKTLLPRLHAVTVDKKNVNVLTVIAYGRSPTETQHYLAGVTKNFLSQENHRYRQAVALLQSHITQLQSTYKRLQAPLKRNQQALAPLSAHENSFILFSLQQSQRDAVLTQLLGNIHHIQNELSPLQTYPTIETLSPRYDPTPVAPKKLLILVLSIIGGLFLGVFLALLANAFSVPPPGNPPL